MLISSLLQKKKIEKKPSPMRAPKKKPGTHINNLRVK